MPLKVQTAKKVSESATEMTELVLPNDTNNLGTILGGKVMHLMDIACAIAARRHTAHAVVTAEVDSLSFLSPIHAGELVVLRAEVNRAFHTSLEVGVKVFAENPTTGERRHTASAYFTFVALDKDGKPVNVPCVIPETADEKRRYEEAALRRTARLKSTQKKGFRG